MKRNQRVWILILGLLVVLTFGVSHAADIPDLTAFIEPVMACSELAEMSFGPGVFITSAESMGTEDGLPAHCEIQGTRFYDAFIVKLPNLWNGRYYQAGNGGAAGSLGDVSMGLKNGFVAASGSGGHVVTDPFAPLFSWAYPSDDLQAQLKLDDYCDGSVHKTMIIAKRILNAYYGRSASRSYYNSCSTGGRQGLVEAQRYPYDFDGIVVGAPVNYLTRITQRGIWETQALLPIGGDFTPGKLQLLSERVMAACDGSDGLVDGLIGDPRECGFNALSDLPACPDGVSDGDCFTLAERTAIDQIYNGPPGAATTPGEAFGSEAVAPGMFGSSSGWVGWVTPAPPFLPFSLGFLLGAGFVQWAGLPPSGGGGPSWDWTSYDFYGSDPGLVIDNMEATCDGTDPDLSLFRANGGKMIMWGGWADPATGPYQWVQYYESVLDFMGHEVTESFFKLYMIPGLQHCGGGLGCFDTQEDLEKLFFSVIGWVEKGKAPKSLTGSRIDAVTGEVLRTRPLCPYPQTAHYHGRGSIDDADNFSCVGRRHHKHWRFPWR